MNSTALVPFMKEHKVCLNDNFPSLNDNGMIFFRDDDVEIGESMCSILTIYQPLFDARDLEFVSLRLDPDDPCTLIHSFPGLPTFMIRDYDKIHKLERSHDNPEFYSETKKKHKKLAYKIKGNKHLKMKSSEFQLPFELATNKVDEINNSGSEFMKNYRTLTLPVNDKITQTCSFVFWKIMIQGETQVCNSDDEDDSFDFYDDAEDRAQDPPGGYCPTDAFDEKEVPDSMFSLNAVGSTLFPKRQPSSVLAEAGTHMNVDTVPVPESVLSLSQPPSVVAEARIHMNANTVPESAISLNPGGETTGYCPFPEQQEQMEVDANPWNTALPDSPSSSVKSGAETPFVGDVVEPGINPPSFVGTSALRDHVARFFSKNGKGDANKKPKLNDVRPMDQDYDSL